MKTFCKKDSYNSKPKDIKKKKKNMKLLIFNITELGTSLQGMVIKEK